MHTDLTPPQIDELLSRHYYGHLACHDGDGLYLVPITFAYSNNTFYAYTQEGKKIEMMRKSPHVCVQAEEIHADGSWESVIAWGTYTEIEDRTEAQKASVLLADNFARFSSADHPMISPLIRDISKFDWENNAPVIYKISIEKVTGRAQKA